MLLFLNKKMLKLCWMIMYLFQSVLGRNKCMYGGSHALCYGCMRLCAFHNSFASYVGMPFVLVG